MAEKGVKRQFGSTAACLLLLLLVAAKLNLGDSLPRLTDIFESSGIREQASELSDEQRDLMLEIIKLVEDDDLVGSKESSLMKEIGLSKPDGKQKGELQVFANERLQNYERLEQLRRQLQQATAKATSREVEQPAAVAA